LPEDKCEKFPVLDEGDHQQDEIPLETFRRHGVLERMTEATCYAFWRVL